jgi:hypothetical protein
LAVRLFGLLKRSRGAAARADSRPATRVRIDSRTYTVAQLWRDAFEIEGYSGDLIVRQRFEFRFLFDVDGKTVEVPTRGVVIRSEGGRLVARFLAPQPYYQKVMRRALAEAVA